MTYLIPEVPHARVSWWPDPPYAELCGCHMDAVDRRQVSECWVSAYTKERAKKEKKNVRVVDLCSS